MIVGVCGFYNFMLTPVNDKEDIVEIDNLRELAALDPYYRKYLEEH